MSFRDDCAKIERDMCSIAEDINYIRKSQAEISYQIQNSRAYIRSLRENLRILKAEKIVVSLAEYKKLRIELALAEQDFDTLGRNAFDAQERLSDLQAKFDKYADIYRDLRKNTGIVIHVDFGKPKDGQK